MMTLEEIQKRRVNSTGTSQEAALWEIALQSRAQLDALLLLQVTVMGLCDRLAPPVVTAAAQTFTTTPELESFISEAKLLRDDKPPYSTVPSLPAGTVSSQPARAPDPPAQQPKLSRKEKKFGLRS